MRRILVATDFSTRSDRALLRGTLLARESAAMILLVHVVDDDQPKRLLERKKRDAMALLRDLAESMSSADGIACKPRVVLGDPFQAIIQAANDGDVDLVVMGPHRRQLLRDVFVGTTVERTIRHGQRPVIMANAVPASSYKCVLVATDFSDCAAQAVRAARTLGLLNAAKVVVHHAFDAPAEGLLLRASTTTQRLREYIAEEQEAANSALREFLHKVELRPSRRIVELIETSAAYMIRQCAREQRADLVVVGTCGRSGARRFLLGSVAAEVLRDAQIDVLAVPPVEGFSANDVP